MWLVALVFMYMYFTYATDSYKRALKELINVIISIYVIIFARVPFLLIFFFPRYGHILIIKVMKKIVLYIFIIIMKKEI